ncbi:MAG: outer membrane protein assembly factor BamD [Phycisphaerales bacterium]|nr:outer membrane protein assembly factor BamD [Phycisphaerales bacterium]MCI0631618.1 outer membrane protein assembly factor BamD [Phycisphaerales bacterium]MCI0674302.1 outer membrane protein assembly factor BamD [Phycisphaerales bacterium]
MPDRSLSFRWLVGVAGVLISTSHAAAQNQYTLTDQNTWAQTQPADPASPEGQLAQARKALASEDYDLAQDLASDWIEQHERHPLLPEAYLIRADALLANGDEYDSLYDYEVIARMYPGSEPFVTALSRELDIAKKYAAGYKRKLFGMRIVGAEDEAEEIFIRVQERLPGSSLAEDAGIHLGDFYFERRQMNLALIAYEKFIENYPRSTHLGKARRRLIYAHLASFKGPEYDAAGIYEARARLQQLKTDQPALANRADADALLDRIDESDAYKLLRTAQWYWQTDNPIAAELTIRRLVKKYPRSLATADALNLIPDILPHLPQRILDQAPNYQAMRDGLPKQ